VKEDAERVRFIATHCNTLQHTATCCNTLEHTATHCNTHWFVTYYQKTRHATQCYALEHSATLCNALQHTAIHCHALQHTTTRYKTSQHLFQMNTQKRSSSCNSIPFPPHSFTFAFLSFREYLSNISLKGQVRAIRFLLLLHTLSQSIPCLSLSLCVFQGVFVKHFTQHIWGAYD